VETVAASALNSWVYVAVLFLAALLLLICCLSYCCCIRPLPPIIKKEKKKKKDDDGPHKVFEPSDKKMGVAVGVGEDEGVLIPRSNPYNVKVSNYFRADDPKPPSSVYGESYNERMFMSGKKRSMLKSSSSTSSLPHLRGRESPILSSSSSGSAVSIVVPSFDAELRTFSSDPHELPPIPPPYAAVNRGHVRSLSGTRMLPTFQVCLFYDIFLKCIYL
jgi:hypothetical protein